MQLTAIIEREGRGYVALCPQLDIASQGENVAEARENLMEALELFFETAERSEVERRLHGEVYVTAEVHIGKVEAILDELDEQRWDMLLAKSPHVLSRLASQAEREDQAGLCNELDPDRLINQT